MIIPLLMYNLQGFLICLFLFMYNLQGFHKCLFLVMSNYQEHVEDILDRTLYCIVLSH